MRSLRKKTLEKADKQWEKPLCIEYVCCTLNLDYYIKMEGCPMAKLKFQIRPKKYTGESSVVSMCLPKDILQEIDAMAAQTSRTRNEIYSIIIMFE